MGVTQEEGPCLIGLLPRDIGGQTCKRRHRNTLRNAISVKGSRQIFTSLEEFLILFLALSPWPFAQWGLDIVGPFPKVVGNKKSLLVCTDYFTKWVEVEPLANIRDVDDKRFIWKNIVTRVGVPYVLISNNGLQFDSKAFKKYYSDLGIKNRYSILAYSQGNGQAEAINKVIVNKLKKRLDDAKGKLVEELPHVLWTYRTTPRKSTGEIPFSMT